MRLFEISLEISLVAAIAMVVCAAQQAPLAVGAKAAAPRRAVAQLSPATNSGVRGLVTFTEQGNSTRVTASLTGLTPGRHGFHIHEKGDCSAPDASSAGGHFNPTGMNHGGPDSASRHVGDFGNIEADASGKARYSQTYSNLTFDGPTSIIGRAVIIHAQPDDLTTQPTGNAGGRVACGVINLK
jgi:Cu-Zn family superoxide dismutase